MSPPRRRSKRLRGNSSSPTKSTKYTANSLTSLIERDETLTQKPQSTLEAILSSPSPPKTPLSSFRVKPALAEMHPSKVHPSTTQEPDSGLRLGFIDIDSKGNNQPSGLTQQTPSKAGFSTPSSSFDFRFARPAPELGPDAQRMMDELREEALRIKAKLAAEREEEKQRERDNVNTTFEGRKIAQAKGKAGRFSEVHMAEFKRMDSIADHPSSFRAQPGRSTPAAPSLKRTQSKARLDEREDIQVEQSRENQIGRLENTAPAKRLRQKISDDTSSARPISRDGIERKIPLPSTPTTSRTQPNIRSSISTPTQASLARSGSLKQPMSVTQIPRLSRSPSKSNLNGTPQTLLKPTTLSNVNTLPRSNSKVILRSPGKLDRVKSILRQTGLSSKKPSAITSMVRTKDSSWPDLDKALPTIPTTPTGVDRSRSIKHVNFTPDTFSKNAATVQSTPSPIKSGIPRSTSKTTLARSLYSSGQLESKKVEYPKLPDQFDHDDQLEHIKYPSLTGSRPLPEPPRQVKSESHPIPSIPGTFTFRSDHTINFGKSPKGFGSSPGQASVRQVRPSFAPNSMPGNFPDSNKENIGELPSISHGMSNKKRRRVDSDDEQGDDFVRSPKKQKSHVAEGQMLMAPNLMGQKTVPQSKSSSPIKKKGLSLSRLNMLARPKTRK